jgi:hypothetical protein
MALVSSQVDVGESDVTRDEHASGAVVAILAGAVLAVGAHVGALALLVVVAVAQAALIGSWVFGTGLPGRIGALLIAGAAAAASDTVVSVWPHGQLGTLLPVVALAVPVAFVHQLTRGVVRNRVVESLSDISVLVVCVVAFAALVQLRHEQLPVRTAYAVVLVIAAALAVGHFTDMVVSVPRFDPDVSRGLLAVVASGVVGALVGRLTLDGEVEFADGRAIFLGAAIGVLAALFAVGSAFIQHATSLPISPRPRRLRPVFGALVPMALVSPVAYLLCLAIHA